MYSQESIEKLVKIADPNIRLTGFDYEALRHYGTMRVSPVGDENTEYVFHISNAEILFAKFVFTDEDSEEPEMVDSGRFHLLQ